MSKVLLNYRTAYLSALAESWRDSSFQEQFLNTNLLDDNSPLIRFGFDYNKTWKALTIKVQEKVDINHKSVESNSIWEPVTTAGWIGRNDRIQIFLPKQLEHGKEEFSALAAATYYRYFPTLMGLTNYQEHLVIEDSSTPLNKVQEKIEQEQEQEQSKNEELNNKLKMLGGALPTDLGISEEKFIEFGGVVLRVLALAWQNPVFRDKLYSEKNDATSIIEEYFGFVNPWNMDIVFSESDNFIYSDDFASFKSIVRNEITLWYPNSPQKHGEIKNLVQDELSLLPIALTDYNSNGAGHPFTCT
ncbi:BMA_0021/BMA_0022 family TOMM bacteriocin [Pseudoalteromonas luteoviolacea]|uniref:BMA_0021/BMA_0022 family TOMM bacteriocin n=1 Tax=Pseudoalteromonas luteoviolacea TaxID=43657 RepID=UPI001B37AE9D|nr:BMA_0021/BMA_0022 family TOMM bacteriocin [Pseudoalteromonas luteoviolacea]MBQ4809904.1 BMA_0021/BMA_0022 family TOMM bacteriocin [Pseudoalteromonas luteoviolacea]